MRFAALTTLLCLVASGADAKVTRYLTGNAGDASPAMLYGPAHDLGGGSTDVDAALQWIIDEVRGCTGVCTTKIDVVILRATGADGYNDYIYAMNGVDSVESLVITSRRDADTAAVEQTILGAEVVFFAGGDQCDYVADFMGTRIETAVEAVYARGGGVGGTSAGTAILGEFVFDACNGTATSDQILANPYSRRSSISRDFFAFDKLEGTLTDQHFVPRDRMGRLMGFLARQIQDGHATELLGIGVNEETSLVVDKDGLATVMGAGPAYFVLADHAPEVCAAKKPLTYSGFKIWRVPAGGTFNLGSRPTTDNYTIDVVDGVIQGSPY